MVQIPKVGIIILVYKDWEAVLELLKSLQKLNYNNFEIVIVDNNSPNRAGSVLVDRLELKGIEKFENKDVYQGFLKKGGAPLFLVQNNENVGFSGGNNLGIRFVLEREADYFWLLNPDTIVESDCLGKLLAINPMSSPPFRKGRFENPSQPPFFKGRSGGIFGRRRVSAMEIIGPWIYFYPEKQKLWFAGGKISWSRIKALHWGLHISLTDEMKKNKPYEVDYITGAAMLIKREVVEKIGFLDEDYFLYYEDADYCLRAKKAGFRSLVVPTAKVYHRTSLTTGLYSPLYIYYMTRSGLMFGWKHSGWLRRIFVVVSLSKLKFLKQIIVLLQMEVGRDFSPFGKGGLRGISLSKRVWGKWITRGIWDFWWGKKGRADHFS